MEEIKDKIEDLTKGDNIVVHITDIKEEVNGVYAYLDGDKIYNPERINIKNVTYSKASDPKASLFNENNYKNLILNLIEIEDTIGPTNFENHFGYKSLTELIKGLSFVEMMKAYEEYMIKSVRVGDLVAVELVKGSIEYGVIIEIVKKDDMEKPKYIIMKNGEISFASFDQIRKVIENDDIRKSFVNIADKLAYLNSSKYRSRSSDDTKSFSSINIWNN